MSTGPRRVVKAPDVRREEIVAAARELFAEQGVRSTTIQDVADRVGVTRGLVYHYAVDMDTLVEEVLEAWIADFVSDLRDWDARREVGNIDGAVLGCIALFRRHVPSRRPRSGGRPGGGGLPRPGPLGPGRAAPRLEDASLSARFVDRAVDALIDTLEVTTIPAYAQRHTIEIRHVRETFHVLIHGLIALVRSHPETSDGVLGDLVRQTLRLAPPSPGVQPRTPALEGD